MNSSTVDLRDAKILIVDDVPANLDVLYPALEDSGYQVLVATSGESALDVVTRETVDLILLDVQMPGIDGYETCRRLKANPESRDVPVIFLTASGDTTGVVEGLESGGVDYVTKPFRHEEVLARVRTHLTNAFLSRSLAERNAQLQAEIAERTRLDKRLTMLSEQEITRWGIDGFVGETPTIKRIMKGIAMLQNADRISVLITGESGTGKELIARAIHTGSKRAGGPFVTLNCATIPDQLAESMLFGHLKGSFTGAERDQTGYFELADGGTLFLDEVGAMSPDLQPKLLRVLEDGLIRPIGAHTDKEVDVRIVSATNAPETFREDLYFRLSRYTVELPPLRDRAEDIPLLARHFVGMFSSEMGVDPPRITDGVMEKLRGYAFPGNVRELKNVVERALIESGGGDIRPEHLRLPNPESDSSTQPAEEFPLNLEEAEAILIQRALDRTDGNVSAAARLLGVDRNKVYRRIGKT